MVQPRAIVLIAALLASLLPSFGQGASGRDSDADTDSYLIGAEDVLDITTWGEPDLTKVVKVRPDGRITLPLVNEVQVAGRTPREVGEIITEKMKEYVRDPRVTVSVQEINHFRVYFLGEVNTQGPIQFYRPTRLLQAISTAGGLTNFSKKEITILREEHGVERRIEVDYKKLLAGEPGHENLYVKPGDTLLVK